MSLLDEVLPSYDIHELHDAWLPAAPEEAWAALMAVTPLEIRLLVPLMALRAIPRLIATGRLLDADVRAPAVQAFLRSGFVVLGERPGHEVVYGVIGRFWALNSLETIRRLPSPEDFAMFAEPGFARAAVNFAVSPEDDGTRMTTETRIAGTDERATLLFRRYWRVVMPGSALIRRSWLAAVRRRVEG